MRTITSVSLPVALLEAMKKISASSGISVSTLTEIALNNFFEFKPDRKGNLICTRKEIKALLLTNQTQKNKEK